MNLSGPLIPPSLRVVMVRDKLVFRDVIPCIHVEYRLGQSCCRRNYATSRLCDLKSCVCRGSAVYVRPIRSMLSLNRCLIGRNQDYLDLNLNFTLNVIKNATILRMFPRPLRPYVATSCHQSASLNQSQDRCTRDIQPSIANPKARRIY